MIGRPLRLGVNGRFYRARPTGVQRFAREVTARLLERDDVVLFLPRNTPIPADGKARVQTGILGGRPWEQVELPIRARAAARNVCLHLAQSAPRFGPRSVVMVHDVTPVTNPEWYTAAFRRWYRVALVGPARRASRVLVPSEWMRREVTRVLGVHAERIDVVSQGISPFDSPADAAAVAAVRARYGLPDRYLLATGGRDRRKNVSFLLEALRRWPAGRDARPVLVVVGAGYAHVQATAPLPATDISVRAVGHVSDAELRALYSDAAAFCFPSLSEGFGRPPLEAMGCGTPAVVADYGPAREVLGEAAIILPRDPDVWMRELVRLVADPTAREGRVRLGTLRVARFRWEATVEAVVAACRTAHRDAKRDRLEGSS